MMKIDNNKNTVINQTGIDEWGSIQQISYNEKTGRPVEQTTSQINDNENKIQ